MASKEAIAKVAKEIFGRVTVNLHGKSGQHALKKPLTGVYLNRWYPEPMEKFARKVQPGYTTAEYDRRQLKLANLRRRGKGPPKKGQGKRAKGRK